MVSDKVNYGVLIIPELSMITLLFDTPDILSRYDLQNPHYLAAWVL